MDVNTVLEGDCLDIMSQLPDNCIDTIITDPPYGLSFMGKDWDYGLPGIAYWRECLRIAKPGTTLMAFGGSRTYHRLTCAIEDAGWEIRDCINYLHDGSQQEAAFMASLNEEQLAAYLELHYPNGQMNWVYGSGFPKSKNISKAIDEAKGMEREVVGVKPGERYKYAFNSDFNFENKTSRLGSGDAATLTAPATPLAKTWDGWGTALKPAFEPIVVAMKPVDKNYAHNAEKWGVAGLHIDGARIGTKKDMNPNDFDDRKRISPKFSGKYNNGKIGQYRNGYGIVPNGRWPANIIHDGSAEVEAEFAKAGVRTSGAKKAGQPAGTTFGDRNGIRADNGKLATSRPPQPKSIKSSQGFASRFFYCAKASQKERSTPGNNHPTQKPLELVKYLCRLTKTPTGGIVLDPFAGSGTTALAAIAEGRDYILIEKEPEYVEICKRRIAEYTGKEIMPKEIVITEKESAKQLALW